MVWAPHQDDPVTVEPSTGAGSVATMEHDASLPSPRVALVHDYVTQRGGAERVVLAMAAALPGAPLYTSLYEPASTYEEFGSIDIRTSPLDRVALLRRKHRLALPLLAATFSRMHVDADVVLCSSSGWAHGARTDGRKIVYCHSPAKWLYAPDRYFNGERPASRRSPEGQKAADRRTGAGRCRVVLKDVTASCSRRTHP